MSFKQVIELADLLDDGRVTGEDVVKYVTAEGNVKATCTTVTGAKGSTDFVKFLIPRTCRFSHCCQARPHDGARR